MPGAAARHAPLPEFSDRQALDPRVRERRKSRAIQVALRLQPVSPREGGHGVSRDPIYDGRFRYPRRSDARQKDGGLDAGRSEERSEQDAPDLIKNRIESGTRRGKARD